MPRIMVVDDDRNILKVLSKWIEAEGMDLEAFDSPTRAIERFGEIDPDLAVIDLSMEEMDGIELLSRMKAVRPEIPIVLLTAFGTVETAVEAMKKGVYDFLTKPVERERLLMTIAGGLRYASLLGEVRRLRARVPGGEMIGSSPAMASVKELIARVAPTDATVLITGETGTGKEVAAAEIHGASRRAEGPFVAINCGAIPGELVESELFGHVRGAFTGAVRERTGAFEASGGGTLFLDEVGELPPRIQVKLLRVIETKRYTRVGETKERTTDARLIAATNSDLAKAVSDGSFREDLFFRLNVFPIEIPPLRERREDIPLLVARFAGDSRISSEALRFLSSYDWPGNVRELRNAMERAGIMAAGGEILPEHLPGEIYERPGGSVNPVERPMVEITDEGLDFFALERDLLRQAIEKAGGNQSQAARLLGMTRHTFIYRAAKYGLVQKEE